MKTGTGVSLWAVADTYMAALADLADRPDLPAEVIADTLEAVQGDLQVKAANVAAFVRNCEAEASLLADHAKALKERAAKAQLLADRLKAYIATQMLRCDLKEVKHEDTRIVLVANPPAVQIEDELAIPADFMRVPTPPPPPPAAPDKKAIGEELKAGRSVPGCVLLKSYRLKIE